jgi:hypothetical protein
MIRPSAPDHYNFIEELQIVAEQINDVRQNFQPDDFVILCEDHGEVPQGLVGKVILSNGITWVQFFEHEPKLGFSVPENKLAILRVSA